MRRNVSISPSSLSRSLISIPQIESKRAIIVSDVHLGYDGSDREAFLEFINTYENWASVDHLIFLGDTFDFWRRQNAKVVVENEEIIRRILSLHPRIVFVRGNHDYYLQDVAHRFHDPLDLLSESSESGRWCRLSQEEESSSAHMAMNLKYSQALG